ncbi:MAG: helix-turn-helix domain-containing protein [Gaiellaceae bacterium]
MFEIGASLREARLRQGLEFVQAEAGTKIRGKYLRALEDEQFAVLPAQTYVKGFLRSYAEYLGLDGQLYVDEFNSRYVANEEEPPIRARRTAAPRRARRIQSGVLLATLVGIALVTALVIAAWTSGSPSHQNLPGVTPPQKQTPVVTPTITAPKIVLTALRRTSLLSVRVGGPNGRVLLSNEPLAAGQVKRFTTKRLWINTGTPENLRITVNGAPVSVPTGPRPFVVTARGVSPA